ncbi:MAG TPA: DUF2490 domain-containing protein [Cyclobacteriaceae bacterium]
MNKIPLVMALLINIAAVAQTTTPTKTIHHREQAWAAYLNQTRLSNKWGLWAEVHYRMTDNFVDRPFSLLIRPGVTYFIKDNLRATAGYALVEHYPAKGLHTTRTEHRIWQQIAWNQKYPRLATTQWLRLEQRYLEKIANDARVGGYVHSWRARYNFSFFVPLKGKDMEPKVPYVMLQNELFLSFGKNVVYNTFDQNRLFLGMGYQFSPQLNAQLGYMNVFQQTAAGNDYFSSNAVRLYVFHTVDLRSKG